MLYRLCRCGNSVSLGGLFLAAPDITVDKCSVLNPLPSILREWHLQGRAFGESLNPMRLKLPEAPNFSFSVSPLLSPEHEPGFERAVQCPSVTYTSLLPT